MGVPERAADQPVTTRVIRNGLVLENAFVRATFQRNGGLVGLRERAASHQGAVEIGPRPIGGYRVRLRIPLERATATRAEHAEVAR